ncbi:PadR family transcriptional regulator [Nonomuraea phyllanthi]|uniref:PadR family transcriptional regulator n=1 Tax=Nonomuraea phyllanthi TaxID=2219224 RepID=A0A5C4WHW6_9ACTN|nr:PadR family transcriptional regulator [Nonomuraea phyllanthi]KAB8193798.1 PadR family transcriptional regulator [Nonomuraea phyllanthi]QFY12538.1 PadR family transcriptional regulator [Nonomuraea phyllanthi]
MSPVFGHGRLRLYLLKLLDESPRHGYEVIRLLQDRFLGVYSPSPGTIYPRLARLEEEGLVTHEVVEGKKVFSITDKGREELNARLDELDDLEEEISASVRDIAREVKEDVRDTVRSLRDELTRMAKDVRTGAADDTRRHKEQQKEDFRRLREQQKRQWMEHAYHWQDEGERLTREWRRIWSELWTTFGGAPPNRADLDLELGERLADFVAQARQEASGARLTPEKLTELRATLDDAGRRIRDILER